MTTDRSIIPKSYPLLMPYLFNTNLRQLATNDATTNLYYEDYGWSAGESAQWTTFKTDILKLYADYTNPLITNHTVKQDLDTAIAAFLTYAKNHTLIEKIRACNIVSNADANTFHFDLVRADPTHLNSKISTIPSPTVKSSGPGTFDMHMRTTTDASRASIDREHGATEVEIAYAIFDQMPTETEGQNPDDTSVFSKTHSVKAHFAFDAGNSNRRKFLVTYFRWNNPSYPQFHGDWCEMQINIIA